MPVKRRRQKGRMKTAEEAEFWADFWDRGGFLLSGWHHVLGVGPVTGPKDWREVERRPEVVEAAREAWGRLGHLHDGDGRWARETFGEPSHAG